MGIFFWINVLGREVYAERGTSRGKPKRGSKKRPAKARVFFCFGLAVCIRYEKIKSITALNFP